MYNVQCTQMPSLTSALRTRKTLVKLLAMKLYEIILVGFSEGRKAIRSALITSHENE